jgi:hypothetical protein
MPRKDGLQSYPYHLSDIVPTSSILQTNRTNLQARFQMPSKLRNHFDTAAAAATKKRTTPHDPLRLHLGPPDPPLERTHPRRDPIQPAAHADPPQILPGHRHARGHHV